MQRDSGYLLDILQAARLALSYISGRTKSSFLGDTQCQDAVVRRLEIIGEAARRVSTATRDAHSQVPWRSMVLMRNVVIHQYDQVDLDIVWETVTNDLPALIAAIEPLVPPDVSPPG
jgi:uncharacterized protein with HEPN domain